MTTPITTTSHTTTLATATPAIGRSPAGHESFLRRAPAELFGRVEHTSTIWANLPPARLFPGREPRSC